MDLKDMRLFLAIAEENNLTRAAQKNGYTQSAASHMLRNIETELGFSLFSRSQRGLALTRNGEALLPPIRRTLAAAEYFDQTAASIRGVQTGHIRIGAYLSASVQWLPPALKKFLSDYPDMTVEVLEGCSQEIEGWLENGSIDFGIVGPHPDGKMDWLPLKKEPYLAVCANDSPYAEYERFDLKDLPKVSYIEEKAKMTCCASSSSSASHRQSRRLPHRTLTPCSRWSATTWGSASCRSWSSAIFLKMLSGCRSIRRWSACSASGFRQQKKRPRLPAC